MFEALEEIRVLDGNQREVRLIDVFHPRHIFEYYRGLGINDQELEELIVDTIVDSWLAYEKEGKKHSLAQFRAFVRLRIQGNVTKVRRRPMFGKGVSIYQWKSKTDDGEEEYEMPLPSVDIDHIQEEVSRSFIANLEVILDKAFPFDTSLPPKVQENQQRKKSILLYRYGRNMSWGSIARNLGLNSSQAAQLYDRPARLSFRRYLSTPNGIAFCHDILGEKKASEFISIIKESIEENPNLE